MKYLTLKGNAQVPEIIKKGHTTFTLSLQDESGNEYQTSFLIQNNYVDRIEKTFRNIQPVNYVNDRNPTAAAVPYLTKDEGPAGDVQTSLELPHSAPMKAIRNLALFGGLDMEKYLNHYGISFIAEEIIHGTYGPATAYRLEKCLFDSHHGLPNDSVIIVPHRGPILYQCSLCPFKRIWKEVRRVISGNRPIAEFCTGYDRLFKNQKGE